MKQISLDHEIPSDCLLFISFEALIDDKILLETADMNFIYAVIPVLPKKQNKSSQAMPAVNASNFLDKFDNKPFGQLFLNVTEYKGNVKCGPKEHLQPSIRQKQVKQNIAPQQNYLKSNNVNGLVPKLFCPPQHIHSHFNNCNFSNFKMPEVGINNNAVDAQITYRTINKPEGHIISTEWNGLYSSSHDQNFSVYSPPDSGPTLAETSPEVDNSVSSCSSSLIYASTSIKNSTKEDICIKNTQQNNSAISSGKLEGNNTIVSSQYSDEKNDLLFFVYL